MLNYLIDRFNQFQGNFTYRQRFICFGLFYFLFILPALYYVLHTLNLYLESKKIQLAGLQYQEQGGNLLGLISQAEIIQLTLVPKDELYNSELKNIGNNINEAFDKLTLLNNHLGLFNQSLGKFFTKNLALDFGIETWKSDWTKIQKASFIEKKGQYQTLVNSLSTHLIENGRSLNLSGNTELINYMTLHLLFDFLIPSQNSISQITLSYNDRSSSEFRSKLTVLEKQEAHDKHKLLKTISLLMRKFPKEGESFQGLREQFLEYFSSMETFFDSMENLNPSIEVGVLAMQVVKKNINLHQLLLDGITKRVSSEEKYYRNLYSLNIIIILIVAIILSIYIALRMITRNLAKLIAHTQMLSRGYFIKCFCSDNKDEFGKVGKAFDIMSNSFETLSLELQDLSVKLSSAINQIFKATEEQESNVCNQEERIKEIEATTQKIADESRQLADTMQKLSFHILQESMADRARESLDIMRTKITDLGEASRGVVGLLEKVEDKMHGMENLIAFMTKVSENANLLSLNAAIETATVTHHKENFAAISQKIQRFANQTVIATNDIKKILQLMTQNVSHVKSFSIGCLKEIGVGADELIKFSSQLTKITRQGKDQLDQFKNFKTMVQAQANETEMMIKSIVHLRKSAEKNTATIQNVNKTLAVLSATANELQKVLKLFEKAER